MRRYSITDTEAYLDHLESPKTPVWENVCQLDNCQAWVVRDTANGLVCLQSYSTIVSFKLGGETVHLGKWTPTTSHHQSRFARRSY